MGEIHREGLINEANENGNFAPLKEDSIVDNSTNSPKNSQIEENGHTVDEVVDTSIEHLYDNVCEMQSSDQSPSRRSFGSDGEESRIDSELGHLVDEGEMREVEIMEEEVGIQKAEDCDIRSDSGSKKESSSAGRKSRKSRAKSVSSTQSKKASLLHLESDATSSPKSRSPKEIPPQDHKQNNKVLVKPSGGNISAKKQKNISLRGVTSQNEGDDSSDKGLENPDLGPFLLKQATDLISSGDNPRKALQFALRAAKSFEKCTDGKSCLDVVICLHVTAAIYCSLGQYSEAIPVLEHSIDIPVTEKGQGHALAKFSGHMQLGDTYSMVGQFENSIMCYTMGLEVQIQVMGDKDPRVGETCRYLAEAHVQALQFDEAEKLCQMAIDIHKDNGSPASIDEAADRRLMGLICETKGDYEGALEHLILASMAMSANGQEKEVASIDLSIGDAYLSLCRYDEAIFAYQKAVTTFKSTKGENHPTVAAVFIRLAELYNKTGKFKDSKSYCENALQIYEKPSSGCPPEEIASGLTDVSAIYESMNELDLALKLLKKALKMYNDAPGQQNTIAGIEAQMGVIYYMLGNYPASYTSFKSTILKLRAGGEKKSAFYGIVLNQMGLTCVQRYAINEAAGLFEEARHVLEQEYGPYHPDTLGVYSNLAGTYDAIGRLEDAIEILEYVVGMREEKLGTANPDVDYEKKRLAELLKEAGRVRSRKARSLENLLDANPHATKRDGTMLQ
ncbi:protein KINESIN LIGHT CHAIN-RELATED 3-like isoform X2 [Apium graveolens]|uniref:protein KINESIN LIGHT CHAIN-RELATED 3-like isoform X2 n=1 Tax=Apium graveolens TaxID=4045 RepID=UPI003D7914DE